MEVTIVVKDGRVDSVYANDNMLFIEVIDFDSDDPIIQKNSKELFALLEEDIASHSMHCVW